MISSLKYLPILLASVVMTSSFLFKILFVDVHWTYFLRDIVVFFIVYFVTKTLTDNLAKIFKNYWKIL